MMLPVCDRYVLCIDYVSKVNINISSICEAWSRQKCTFSCFADCQKLYLSHFWLSGLFNFFFFFWIFFKHKVTCLEEWTERLPVIWWTVCRPDITSLVKFPQWGTADAEIKVPSVESPELKDSPSKAWSGPVCRHECYALPSWSIHQHFFLNLSWVSPVFAVACIGYCVGLQNQIDHPAHRYRRLMVVLVLSACGIYVGSKTYVVVFPVWHYEIVRMILIFRKRLVCSIKYEVLCLYCFLCEIFSQRFVV